jgi:ABC-type cobalamin/Fe3+-siderophores transport system ATPase subunit
LVLDARLTSKHFEDDNKNKDNNKNPVFHNHTNTKQQKQKQITTNNMDGSIRNILLQSEEIDTEVVDYLMGIIQSELEDDDDCGGDRPQFVETMREFLPNDDDTVQRVLSIVQNERKKNSAGKSKHVVTTKKVEPRQPPTEEPSRSTAAPAAKDDESHSPKSHRGQRKEKRKQKQASKRQPKQQQQDDDDDDDPSAVMSELNDHSSAWEETQRSQGLWGGRGRGGRGVRVTGDNYESIHLPSVSLQFLGRTLLEDSTMDILKGHRYGVLGRNGVGKSTLFRALADHQIPGVPRNYRVVLVNQQQADVPSAGITTALQAVLQADTDLQSIQAEQQQVERDMEAHDGGVENVEKLAERYSQLLVEWDALEGDTAEDRAVDILKGLGFDNSMIQSPTTHLSGGWRMRLALAKALFIRHTDLLLLDEVSNHLDLHGMAWLIEYLKERNDLTMMVRLNSKDLDGFS